MKRHLTLALLGVVVGGCSMLEPKGGSEDITVLPDDPARDRTILSEGEPLPPGAVVLPADDEVMVESSEIVLSDAEAAEDSVVALPDAEVVEIIELDGGDVPVIGDAGDEASGDVYLPDEIAASADAEAIIIPAGVPPAGGMEMTPVADAIRVEIHNASGVPGLEQQVSERLAGKGYFISWAGEGTTAGTQRETYIRYRPSYARQAVKLGHILPGNQIVTKGDELSDGVDIQIIVGSDQQQ